ncbi:hypothetical protein ACFCX0_38485 [Streptomyces sp. NPDC056352]|uniref:hypothetical protein n=1 Tax=Streptomyces sp. NPDC056352 TaxID=3345791 RepID=UPI0035E03A79
MEDSDGGGPVVGSERIATARVPMAHSPGQSQSRIVGRALRALLGTADGVAVAAVADAIGRTKEPSIPADMEILVERMRK